MKKHGSKTDIVFDTAADLLRKTNTRIRTLESALREAPSPHFRGMNFRLDTDNFPREYKAWYTGVRERALKDTTGGRA